jgi:hypothetical protein
MVRTAAAFSATATPPLAISTTTIDERLHGG